MRNKKAKKSGNLLNSLVTDFWPRGKKKSNMIAIYAQRQSCGQEARALRGKSIGGK
jgi:hypothetical protein